MTFAISTPGEGTIEITSADFEQAKLARQNLSRILAIEDKFDLVVANYFELERGLLELALQQMIYNRLTWSAAQYDIQGVNRRIANLLSACRLYADQIMHEVSQLQDVESSISRGVRSAFSEQYDKKLGYRVMEASRNYAQHRTLPVHELTYPSRWVDVDSGLHCVFSIVSRISVMRLREDPSFKEPILAELDRIGSSIPLTPLIREYLEGLSIVQDAFRKLVAKDVCRWEDTFALTWKRAADRFGETQSVEIVALDESGGVLEREQIFGEIIRHREELMAKNQVLANLALRFHSCPN